MNRQILVPLDGSALAESILPHAATLARLTGSSLTLMRAVPVPVMIEAIGGAVAPSSSTWQAWEAEMADARDYLADIARCLQHDGFSVQTELIDAPAATAILSYASQNSGVIAIAMATHGRSGLKRWVFGSVTEKVLHAATKPLLLARPQSAERATAVRYVPEEPTAYHTIVVPMDGSPVAEHALGWAQGLATASGAELVLVSVASTEEPELSRPHRRSDPASSTATLGIRQAPLSLRQSCYLPEMVKRLEATGLTVRGEFTHGHPAEKILQLSNQANADLIVMATHGRSGLQRMWLGSVALKVVQGSAGPVLLVRA
jgi:nucleotide-binding universal stress UspA family protein